MATEPSVTEQLKTALADIQQPPLPDEFYLAPGVIVLAVLLLLLLAWLTRLLYRRYQRDNARRLALDALALIVSTEPGAANAVLLLLKQYLQTKAPGHPALALSSAGFVAFLQHSGQLTATVPDLDLLLYSPAQDPATVQSWQQFARQWLKQHREHALYV